jgi:hypothetical protein
MNNLWRTVLRNRKLASVRVHRKPAPPVPVAVVAGHMLGRTRGAIAAAAAPVQPAQPVVPAITKPYLHIIFKKDAAEPWMTAFESVVPKTPVDWLVERGFGNMEYFDVRVGVEQDAEH